MRGELTDAPPGGLSVYIAEHEWNAAENVSMSDDRGPLPGAKKTEAGRPQA